MLCWINTVQPPIDGWADSFGPLVRNCRWTLLTQLTDLFSWAHMSASGRRFAPKKRSVPVPQLCCGILMSKIRKKCALFGARVKLDTTSPFFRIFAHLAHWPSVFLLFIAFAQWAKLCALRTSDKPSSKAGRTGREPVGQSWPTCGRVASGRSLTRPSTTLATLWIPGTVRPMGEHVPPTSHRSPNRAISWLLAGIHPSLVSIAGRFAQWANMSAIDVVLWTTQETKSFFVVEH